MKLKLRIGAVALLALSLGACSEFSDDAADVVYQESVKDLSGKWQLTSVLRNEVDITDEMDFSQFCLVLSEDGKYSFENYLPFVVNKEGTWKIDDPKYPYFLTFTETETNETVTIKINYPIIDGSRRITLTLSPGSVKNSYNYEFCRFTDQIINE